MSLLTAQHSFLGYMQEHGQSVDKNAIAPIGWAETIKVHGGTIAANYKLVLNHHQMFPQSAHTLPEDHRPI
jgi:hypothetical protein